MIKSIPFSILPLSILKKQSKFFIGLAKSFEKGLPSVAVGLKQARAEFEASQYIAMCIYASAIFFVVILALLLFFLGLFQVKSFVLVSFIVAFILLFFVF